MLIYVQEKLITVGQQIAEIVICKKCLKLSDNYADR